MDELSSPKQPFCLKCGLQKCTPNFNGCFFFSLKEFPELSDAVLHTLLKHSVCVICAVYTAVCASSKIYERPPSLSIGCRIKKWAAHAVIWWTSFAIKNKNTQHSAAIPVNYQDILLYFIVYHMISDDGTVFVCSCW